VQHRDSLQKPKKGAVLQLDERDFVFFTEEHYTRVRVVKGPAVCSDLALLCLKLAYQRDGKVCHNAFVRYAQKLRKYLATEKGALLEVPTKLRENHFFFFV
jgi:hypothetical protein